MQEKKVIIDRVKPYRKVENEYLISNMYYVEMWLFLQKSLPATYHKNSLIVKPNTRKVVSFPSLDMFKQKIDNHVSNRL